MGGPALAMQGAVDGAPGVGDPYFPNLGNSGYDVQHYDLTLQINPKRHRVNGVASIALTPTAGLRSFTFDLVGFNVSAVDVDGVPARIERPERKLRIVPEQVLASGMPVVVRVTYAGKPTRLGLNGWYWFKDGGALLSTQPEGASMLFPCNDHPIDKATFGFDVTTRRGTVAVANGLMQGAPERDGKRMRFRWSEPGAFPTYAAVVAVGRFQMKSSFADGALPVINAFPKGEKDKKSRYKHEKNRKKRADLAGNSVKRLTKCVGPQRDVVSLFERYFGPYPYSSIGAIITSEDRPEAMEAATRPTYPGVANALKDKYFKMLVAHEISHMWAGNMVTPETWRDIWLNEGFATYSELLWISEARDLPLGSLFAFSSCCFGYFKGMELPAGDPGADNLFSVTVYNRGAMTLEALRRTIGDEIFFRLMREWLDRYRGQNVSTEDFIQLAEEMSGQQLDDFFQTWLYVRGLPSLPPDPNAAGRAFDDGSGALPELRDDAEFRGHRVGGGEP